MTEASGASAAEGRNPNPPAGVGEARPAEPADEQLCTCGHPAYIHAVSDNGVRVHCTDDECVNWPGRPFRCARFVAQVCAPGEERPDARARADAWLAGELTEELRASQAENQRLREQLDAANREAGEYRRMWEETLRDLDAAREQLDAAREALREFADRARESDSLFAVWVEQAARAALGVVGPAPNQATDEVSALGQTASETRGGDS